jgi:hypothetical protein
MPCRLSSVLSEAAIVHLRLHHLISVAIDEPVADDPRSRRSLDGGPRLRAFRSLRLVASQLPRQALRLSTDSSDALSVPSYPVQSANFVNTLRVLVH